MSLTATPPFPSLSQIRQTQHGWHSASTSPARARTEPSTDEVLRALHATVAALQDAPVEAYIVDGAPARPLRMAQLYDRLIALHGELSSLFSTSFNAVQQCQRQDAERQSQAELAQWPLRRTQSVSPPPSIVLSPASHEDTLSLRSSLTRESALSLSPLSAPVRPVSPHLVYATSLTEIVAADSALRAWVSNADAMSAVATLAVLLCRLLHREGRDSRVCAPRSSRATTIAAAASMTKGPFHEAADFDTHDDEDSEDDNADDDTVVVTTNVTPLSPPLETPTGRYGVANKKPHHGDMPTQFTITRQPSIEAEPAKSVPWFSLTSLLSKLLLLAETSLAVSARVRPSLSPRALQLVSVVLATVPTEALTESIDPCQLLADQHVVPDHNTASRSSFCFSSALRANAVRLARLMLLTPDDDTTNTTSSAAHVTLPAWQWSRLLGCVVAQLRAPATETRVYELAVWTLQACARDHHQTDASTIGAVVAALCVMLGREDVPSARTVRTPLLPDVSPLPDGGLLLPSPATSTLRLPQYQQDTESSTHKATLTNTTTTTFTTGDEAIRRAPAIRRPTEGIRLSTWHTAAVEVQRAPAVKIVRTVSPRVSWREAVEDDRTVSVTPHRGEDGPLHGDLNALSVSSLPSSSAPPADGGSTIVSALSPSLPSLPHVMHARRASPSTATSSDEASTVSVAAAVSSETILREWYQRFQAPVIQSAQWTRTRRGSLTSSPPSGLRACASSLAASAAMPTHTATATVTAATRTSECEVVPPLLPSLAPHSPTSPGLSPPLCVSQAAYAHTRTTPSQMMASPSASDAEGGYDTTRARHPHNQPPFLPLPQEVEEETSAGAAADRCSAGERARMQGSVRRSLFSSTATTSTTSLVAAAATLHYPSQPALRLSVVRCLHGWCLFPLETATAASDVANGLARLAQTRVMDSVVQVLEASSGKAERPLRAALRHWLCETLTWLTLALARTAPAALEGITVPLAESLSRCLPLLHSAANPAATGMRVALPGQVHGTAAAKRLRGAVPSIEATESHGHVYQIVLTALTALAHLVPLLGSTATDTAEVQALVQTLMPLTLHCLTATSPAARSGAPALGPRSPPPADALRRRALASPSLGHTGYLSMGHRRETRALKAAATSAGELPLSTLQEQAARVVRRLCSLTPLTLRYRSLGRHYEGLLLVVMALVRGQTTRLSSTRVLVRALASKLLPRRARAMMGASSTPTTSSTGSEASTAGFCTTSEVRALVDLLEVFLMCVSDMLRVHPYYRRSEHGDEAGSRADCVSGAQGYYRCLHLISRTRFLHTLLRLGSSAAVATLTESASREVGVEVGQVALDVVRRLFAIPTFAVEDRVALLTEANASGADDYDEENDRDDHDDDHDATAAADGLHDDSSHSDVETVTDRAGLEKNTEPLLTLAAQLFRLLDLDTRCPQTVRTHVKQRLVQWVRAVFEACPPRLTEPGDGPLNADCADTTVATAMLKHQGFLEQLTADVERAAASRSRVGPAPADAGEARERALSASPSPAAPASLTPSSASLAHRDELAGPASARRRPESDALEAIAEEELAMLLILLRHLPRDTEEEGNGTAESAGEAGSRAGPFPSSTHEPRLSSMARRRLVALQLSSLMVTVIRASGGRVDAPPSTAAASSPTPTTTAVPRTASRRLGSPNSPATVTSPSASFPRIAIAIATPTVDGALGAVRDGLLELAVRVLHEWLCCVHGGLAGAVEAHSADSLSSLSSLSSSPSVVRSLHATDSVQRDAVVSAPATALSSSPWAPPPSVARPRGPGVQIWASTQQDFAEASEDEARPYNWVGFPFHADPSDSATSFATAPWTRRLSFGRQSPSPTTSSNRLRRVGRQGLPRRLTTAPMVTMIDHDFYASTYERQLSSHMAPILSTVTALAGLRSALGPRHHSIEVADTVGSNARSFPLAILDEYLRAQERYLPEPVIDAFRGLLKAGKKKDG